MCYIYYWNKRSAPLSYKEAFTSKITKHKNFDKAIGLLPVRFQDCSVDEVADRLYWDLQHVKNDQYPDYEQFAAVLSEAERLVPGVSAKMREKYGECES